MTTFDQMVYTHIHQFKNRQSTCILFLVLFGCVCAFILYSATKHFRVEFNTCNPRFNNANYSKTRPLFVNDVVDPKWIYHMHNWTNRKGPYSQGSQDLYLEKIFSVINTASKYFVEFGFNELSYDTGGTGANTKKLYKEGWHGLLLDGNRENEKINLKKHYLFATNIASIFENNSVPKDLDFLSCDMDSHDLWVLRAILQAGYRPRVMTTEYNSNYDINDAITLFDPTLGKDLKSFANYKHAFSGCAWGAGAGALRMVAEAHGYTMIGRVRTLDLIWLRNDLLATDHFDVPPFEWFFRDAPIGKLHHYPQSSPNTLSRIVDYKTYVLSGENFTASNEAARIILKKRQMLCYQNVYEYL